MGTSTDVIHSLFIFEFNDVFVGRGFPGSLDVTVMVAFQTALIATHTLLEVFECLIGAGISISAFALRFEEQS